MANVLTGIVWLLFLIPSLLLVRSSRCASEIIEGAGRVDAVSKGKDFVDVKVSVNVPKSGGTGPRTIRFMKGQKPAYVAEEFCKNHLKVHAGYCDDLKDLLEKSAGAEWGDLAGQSEIVKDGFAKLDVMSDAFSSLESSAAHICKLLTSGIGELCERNENAVLKMAENKLADAVREEVPESRLLHNLAQARQYQRKRFSYVQTKLLKEKTKVMREMASLLRMSALSGNDLEEPPDESVPSRGRLFDIPRISMQQVLDAPEIYFNHSKRGIPLIITNSTGAGLLPWTELSNVASKCGGPRNMVPLKERADEASWAGLHVTGEYDIFEYTKAIDQLKYIQGWQSPMAKRYLHDLSIPVHCPQMLDPSEFRIPSVFAADVMQILTTRVSANTRIALEEYSEYWPSLFVGIKGTSSQLHADWAHTAAWMGVVRGSKHWVIVPEAYRKYLDVSEKNLNAFAGDIIDGTRGNADEELIKATGRYQGIVREGEIIFIPPRAPHQVKNLETTIAVAFNFVGIERIADFIDGLDELTMLSPSVRGTRAYEELRLAATQLKQEYQNGERALYHCANGTKSLLSYADGVPMEIFKSQKLCAA